MNTQTTDKYFDLHTIGIGYLNRARIVAVKRGAPFLAVDINAMHGAAEDVQHTRFDCRVAGTEAQALIREFMPAIEADKKVLVGFKLGDLYAETFTYQSGEKQGQTGVSLKARLLRITWAKIDGQDVYRSSPDQEANIGMDEAVDSPTSEPMAEAPQGVIKEGPESLPTEVRLSKDDPAFEQKKTDLKQQGYRWDAEHHVWRLPTAA